MRDLGQLLPGEPFQHALVALFQGAGITVGSEQVHIFGGPTVGHKGDDAAVAVIGEGQAGLLINLPQNAVLGTFPVLEFSADADPLIFIEIVFFFDPVEHEIVISTADITQGGVEHG